MKVLNKAFILTLLILIACDTSPNNEKNNGAYNAWKNKYQGKAKILYWDNGDIYSINHKEEIKVNINLGKKDSSYIEIDVIESDIEDWNIKASDINYISKDSIFISKNVAGDKKEVHFSKTDSSSIVGYAGDYDVQPGGDEPIEESYDYVVDPR